VKSVGRPESYDATCMSGYTTAAMDITYRFNYTVTDVCLLSLQCRSQPDHSCPPLSMPFAIVGFDYAVLIICNPPRPSTVNVRAPSTMERPSSAPIVRAQQCERFSIADTVEYVLERGYKRVTLQFPDEMLAEAPAVARALQDELHACTDAKVRRMTVPQWRGVRPCSAGGGERRRVRPLRERRSRRFSAFEQSVDRHAHFNWTTRCTGLRPRRHDVQSIEHR